MTAPSAELSPARRTTWLAGLGHEPVDVLVVGGGIVGAGAALDAAARGLSVVIVEADDWASGTSSRSSKLIHGGLRYVKSGDLSLVREALRERGTLLRLAPHLVHPARFHYPLRHRIEWPYVTAGVAIYDLLARRAGGGPSLLRGRHLGANAARALAPSLRHSRVRGGVVYSDAQVDDARFVLAVLRTAVLHGATALSGVRVTGLLEEDGRTTGARVQAVGEQDERVIRAGVVLVAAGVWTGEIAAMAGGEILPLRPSKGVHLVFPRAAIAAETALILPTRKSVLFVLPWQGHWIVGTTDTAWGGPASQAVATRADVDYLLGELNAVLRAPLTREQIESVFVGVRPLVGSAGDATTTLSREHAVATPRAGLALVAGGKYTTYRVMARDLVDAGIISLGRPAPRSNTDGIPLIGAEGYPEALATAPDKASRHGLGPAEYQRLLERYGTLVDELLSTVAVDDPLGRLEGAPGYLRAEFAYGVTHEGARSLEDLLTRRTRLSIESADRGGTAAEPVAELVAPLLGWNAQAVDDEVSRYRERVKLWQRTEELPGDEPAIAAAGADLGQPRGS